MESKSQPQDTRPVFFFDIDNCLYPRSKEVFRIMQKLIDDFFMTHLSLSFADANELHHKYYKQYGLAIEGLYRHNKIDPLEFNRQVDDALPLDTILSPDPALRQLLLDMDTTKVKLWLFTNAHITHGKRVVRLLGIDDLFEGITYCDYEAKELLCKPHEAMFEKAERDAGLVVGDVEKCYFVDDSETNCRGALKRGWTVLHLVEPGLEGPEKLAGQYQVSHLEELRGLFPQFFKEREKGSEREVNGV